ncbi:hypothetical protein F5883DRAFT_563456 [Diaporthe sp. PMI_573]|nr:hypothetical protein F5883DRAFT_563456 [Diaporthaceae sp. PMI_573]
MNESIKSFASDSGTVFADKAEARSTTQQQIDNRNPPLQTGSSPFLVPYNLGLVTMTDIFRACLGSMYLEKASTAQLNYSAYEEYCRSTMIYLDIAPFLRTNQSGGLNKAVLLDVLQMIRCGLHKHEIIATLQHRISCGLDSVRSIGISVDRVASLLVMVDIGDNYEAGCGMRTHLMPWTHGSLRDNINGHFQGEVDLSDMGIRLGPAFTMKNLVKIAGLRISWTANLADHLRLDSERNVMHVFHHVTFLECQRKSPESLLPKSLVEETLTTLALLFPSQLVKGNPSWLRGNASASTPAYDTSLHAVGVEPLEPHKREIRSFYYWHDRLVILKHTLDESSATTHSPLRLWYDRRNTIQWYNLWVVVVFGALSLSMTTAQLVLSSVQLSRSSHHAHYFSTGAIVGIAFGGIMICIVAVGLATTLHMFIRRFRWTASDGKDKAGRPARTDASWPRTENQNQKPGFFGREVYSRLKLRRHQPKGIDAATLAEVVCV